MDPAGLGTRLRRLTVLRAVAALGLAAYTFFQAPPSAPGVARACAAYWVADGVVVFALAGFARSLGSSRLVFVLRAAIAIVSGVVVLVLPLGVVFGQYQLGQGMLFILVATIVLGVVGVQLGAAALDALICRAIRRGVPGDWSCMLAGVFSVMVALALAGVLVWPSLVADRTISIVAAAAGLGFVVAALTLGPASRSG